VWELGGTWVPPEASITSEGKPCPTGQCFPAGSSSFLPNPASKRRGAARGGVGMTDTCMMDVTSGIWLQELSIEQETGPEEGLQGTWPLPQ